jgi:hypothetical protein
VFHLTWVDCLLISWRVYVLNQCDNTSAKVRMNPANGVGSGSGAINVTTKQERKSEFLANRLFMFISGLLVVVSLAAFLWLAGVLEWRGSDGDSTIDVTLQCENPAPKGVWAVTFLDLEDSTIEVDSESDTENLKQHCPTMTIRSARKPQAVISAGKPDAPGDDQQIAAHFLPKSIGASPPLQQAEISTVERLRLQFTPGELLHYVGLGERDVFLHLEVNLAQKDSFWMSPRSRTLQIRPPTELFYIASSKQPAELNPNDIWNIDLSKYDQNQTVEVSFRNDRLARLDHIIDSSIAAVLGVGAGGIMSAWLALRITRSRTT